jgi:signal transduction histidine kinase
MSSLINGFLNLSRMESGKIHLNIAEFGLDELLTELVAETRVLHPEQQFELQCNQVSINADRDKIGTVVTNLLSNAVKYAKNKKVAIRGSVADDQARVSVKDEGDGIISC